MTFILKQSLDNRMLVHRIYIYMRTEKVHEIHPKRCTQLLQVNNQAYLSGAASATVREREAVGRVRLGDHDNK